MNFMKLTMSLQKMGCGLIQKTELLFGNKRPNEKSDELIHRSF